MNLYEYVLQNTVRGACQCGHCFDAPENPEDKQPPDSIHTIDLTFFKVARIEGGDAETFRELVQAEHPNWLDGEEHNYLNVGAEMGDQGVAMMTIGLGHLLGVWQALCPETMMPFMPDEVKKMLAGQGMIALQVTKAPEVTVQS